MAGCENTNYPPATLWRRLAALVYDSFLLFGLLFAATAIILPFTDGQAITPGNLLFTIYLLAVIVLFYGWCWTHGGQTLGMKAWHIRVQGNAGHPLTWSQALLRCAAAALSWAVLGVGYLWSLIDRESLTWHDRLSGSMIVLLKH